VEDRSLLALHEGGLARPAPARGSGRPPGFCRRGHQHVGSDAEVRLHRHAGDGRVLPRHAQGRLEGGEDPRARARSEHRPTPLGYRRRPDGTLEQDPQEAPVVAEAFERAARTSLAAALDYLGGLDLVHEAGKPKDRPRTWTTGTVRRLLANRTYLGEIRWGDLPTTHVPSLRSSSGRPGRLPSTRLMRPAAPRATTRSRGWCNAAHAASGWWAGRRERISAPIAAARACDCGRARRVLRRSTCSQTASRPTCAGAGRDVL
jgi:hypothetical protein